MRILFVHKGLPAQFTHLIPALSSRGDELWAIGMHQKHIDELPGINFIKYHLHRGNGKDTYPLASELESKIIRGEAVARVAAQLAEGKFTRGYPWEPDIIIGHPGWGEMLFIADVWPHVPQLHYVEFFYGVRGTDNDIHDIHATPKTWHERARDRVKNANLLSNLCQMSAGLCPTKFQHGLLPDWAKIKTHVIHDGIDTNWLTPDPRCEVVVPPTPERPYSIVLNGTTDIITFINRTFEPYRGVHVFLDALVKVQALHPTAHTILVGEDTPNVAYGARRSDGKGWLTALRGQLGDKLDWRRIHHLGTVNHHTLRNIYRVSKAHIYLSYPFVLSWSLLEAMSCGALVIGSSTAPVQEVITDKINGLLVPFEDYDALANIILNALKKSDSIVGIRKQARKHIIDHYDVRTLLKRQLSLIDSLVPSKKIIA